MTDTDLFMERLKAKREAEAQRLAQAVAEAEQRGKEPFDLDVFETLYDTHTDLGFLPPRTDREKVWRERYYVRYPDVMTVKALAELLNTLN